MSKSLKKIVNMYIPTELSQTKRGKSLKKRLHSFVSKEFGNFEKYFCIIYGSYAYGQENQESDFDFMIVAGNISPGRIDRCIRFAKKIHKELKTSDEEVRYEHKVLISCEFMELACDGNGFKNHEGHWFIPKINKTPEILTSIWFRLRFLHALMVHCNHFVLGDKEYYEALRFKAAINLLKAVCSARKIDIVTAEELFSLFMTHGKDTGDYYLGFRDNIVSSAYLRTMCKFLLETLADQKIIHKNDNVYNLKQFVQFFQKANGFNRP